VYILAIRGSKNNFAVNDFAKEKGRESSVESLLTIYPANSHFSHALGRFEK
jgi:hypothetical protein